MKYPVATRDSVRVLACVLTCLLMISQSHSAHAQDSLRWSAGIRTGSYYEFYNTRRGALNQNEFQYLREGFLHQLFVNFTPGKRRKWMLEANLGYNNFSYEDVDDGLLPGGGNYSTYTNNITRMLSLAVEAKYKIASWPAARWHHYAGLSFVVQRQFLNSFYGVSSAGGGRSISTETSAMGSKRYGIVYSGKIDITKRLSAQYNFGYSYSRDNTTHRLQGTLGFGYHF